VDDGASLDECDLDDFGSGHSGALRLLEDIDPGDCAGPILRGEFEWGCISPGVDREFNILFPDPILSFRAAEVRYGDALDRGVLMGPGLCLEMGRAVDPNDDLALSGRGTGECIEPGI